MLTRIASNQAMSPPLHLLAAIEAGGTKFVCAIAREPDQPLRQERIPTTMPAETLDRCIGFFRQAEDEFGPIGGIGIGTFGPAAVTPGTADFGRLLTTPKVGWSGFRMLDYLLRGMGRPIPAAFDTDVNAALVGEMEHGTARGFRHVAYVTVGTGIGGAFVHDCRPLHGRMHTEIGHMSVPNLDAELGLDTCVCPFHRDCLEGRASGPAIEARWGAPASTLPSDHPAWELEARYLAHAAINLTAAWSPQIIVFGGGVCQQQGLIEEVRDHFAVAGGGYWTLPPIQHYLRRAALNQDAGIIGALTLAARAVTGP